MDPSSEKTRDAAACVPKRTSVWLRKGHKAANCCCDRGGRGVVEKADNVTDSLRKKEKKKDQNEKNHSGDLAWLHKQTQRLPFPFCSVYFHPILLI